MTIRLFDADSHLRRFTARVLSSENTGDRWETALDQTAFFPEGGGQSGDSGVLGGVEVFDTHERGGVIYHYSKEPLPVGSEVTGELNWEARFARMQAHSGEHIISGIVHRLFGYANVGFHIGAGAVVTLDFDGELTAEDVSRIEELANAAVYDNLTVTARYPSPEELLGLNYRSKLDLTENVRIVTVEGVDVCACCAPHVNRTGEVGLIKITDAMRHRGGMRLTMLAGGAAFSDYRSKSEAASELSAMLSAKRDELPVAVSRVMAALEDTKRRLGSLSLALVRSQAEALEVTEGSVCLFRPELEVDALRELVNLASQKARVAAAFTGQPGSLRYIIGSRSVDLRAASKVINTALQGRGGGTPEMIQGSCAASETEIQAFFDAWPEGNS